MNKLRKTLLTINTVLVILPWIIILIIQNNSLEKLITYSSFYPDGFLWLFWIVVCVDIILLVVYMILKRRYQFKPEHKSGLFWFILVLMIIYGGFFVYQMTRTFQTCCAPPPYQYPQNPSYQVTPMNIDLKN